MRKEIIFLLRSDAPPAAHKMCGEACSRLRAEGWEASVLPAKGLTDIPQRKDGLLFVADDADTVRALRAYDIPAVALRYKENAETDFSGVPYIFEEPEEVDADSYLKAYQRMKGLPWDVFTTERLHLRESTVEDVDVFYRLYEPPEMTRFMEGLFEDPADEKRYMADYIRNVYDLMGFGVWTVTERLTGDIVGRCGFSVRNGFEHVELGFLTGVPYQRMGYATEAVAGALAYGREVLGFDTVQALVREGNDVSLRLLKRAGFHEERTLEVEEDIYGGVYPGFAKGRIAISPARTGRYTLLAIDL